MSLVCIYRFLAFAAIQQIAPKQELVGSAFQLRGLSLLFLHGHIQSTLFFVLYCDVPSLFVFLDFSLAVYYYHHHLSHLVVREVFNLVLIVSLWKYSRTWYLIIQFHSFNRDFIISTGNFRRIWWWRNRTTLNIFHFSYVLISIYLWKERKINEVTWS